MEQNFYDMSDHELLQAKMSIKREIDRYKKKMEELNGYLTIDTLVLLVKICKDKAKISARLLIF